MHAMTPLHQDEVSVLGKAMAVLDAFAAEDLDLNLAELGRRTGLAKATLHRVTNDLVRVGMLDRDGFRYRLSGRLFELGMRASLQRGLIEVATPFLEDLYERTHETIHLGVRDHFHVVYIAKIGGHHQAAAPSRIGGRMPLHCTAIGKVLLAHSDHEVVHDVLAAGLNRRAARTITSAAVLAAQLQTIAETGLAFEYEESAAGIACIGAPVFRADGVVVAAMSVTGPIPRFVPERHRGALRAATSGMSAVLARRQEFDEQV